MKNTILIILFCLLLKPLTAQRVVEKHMSFDQKESVTMDIQIADSIVLHTWDKNEVYVKALINVNDNKDNDLYQVEFDESSVILKMRAKFEDKIHRHNSLESNITWDVYLPKGVACKVKTINGNISVYGQSGALNLKTISGNIIVISNPISIEANSISGFVDITMPSDKKADLNFKNISGTIYTNHELTTPVKKKPASTKVFDQMNGGGDKIDLSTISGNIYFRK